MRGQQVAFGGLCEAGFEDYAIERGGDLVCLCLPGPAGVW